MCRPTSTQMRLPLASWLHVEFLPHRCQAHNEHSLDQRWCSSRRISPATSILQGTPVRRMHRLCYGMTSRETLVRCLSGGTTVCRRPGMSWAALEARHHPSLDWTWYGASNVQSVLAGFETSCSVTRR
ncbi:hypothetical protein LZ30DRAFT_367946 [Colletotrichum cereale]|nr:hypothetical protein LZ30DRAFT_367946 [Colletotrichum cereale]